MHTMMRTWLVALALPLGACGAGEPSAAGFTVRDSAGIRIVENTAPAWREGEAWRLDDAPALAIGVREGDPHDQLYRVQGAWRFADGRIVVANEGTRELRFYDATGRFLSASGGEGEGPGEFRGIGRLDVVADTILVYDYQNLRLSVLTSDGAYFRSIELSASGAVSQFAGVFADGTSLLGYHTRPLTPETLSGGVLDQVVMYGRLDRAGMVVDTLGEFWRAASYIVLRETGISMIALPFGRVAATAVSGDAFYYGTGDRYEIARYTADGRLTRLIRAARENLAVTPDAIEGFIQERLAFASGRDAERRIRERYRDIPFPATMPAYAALMVDAEANLWVEDYRRPGDERPRWSVFDPDGRLLGSVALPVSFTPYQIGADFVLGVRTDALDVERVELYRLVKGRGGRDGAIFSTDSIQAIR